MPLSDSETGINGASTGQKLCKRFGQHLLTDKNMIANIVQAINPFSQQTLCEIGPGLGAITLPLLEKRCTLHALEIDRYLSEALSKKCWSATSFTLHQVDALRFDFNAIGSPSRPIRLVGNLPYNISTPLLFHLLSFPKIFVDMHFMLQKEVAERITAAPGESGYSRLSVMVQSYYKTERLFDVMPQMFAPPPKVTSSFMCLIPRDARRSTIIDPLLFSKIVKTAFRQRRKTIKNSLASVASTSQLHRALIDPSQRPQEISILQYIRLANQISACPPTDL